MKITDVKLTPISYPMPFNLRWGRGSRDDVGGIVVQVFTDEAITGIGYVDAGSHAITARALDAILLPLLKGQNPLDIGRVWEAMYAATVRAGIGGWVMGGIDIALWDILLGN